MQKSIVFPTLAALLIFAAAIPPTLAQEPDHPQSEMPAADASPATEEQRVLATEDEWVNAEIRRDEVTLRRVLDDRYVYNRNNGSLSTKEGFIQGVLGSTLAGETITDRTILVDGDLAVTFGTAEIRFHSEGGGDHVSVMRYTATYVKRGDQWRAIALQMAKARPAGD